MDFSGNDEFPWKSWKMMNLGGFWAILFFVAVFIKMQVCQIKSNNCVCEWICELRLFQGGGHLVRRRRYIILQNERFAVYSRMWMAQANSDEGSLWEGVASNMRHVSHGRIRDGNAEGTEWIDCLRFRSGQLWTCEYAYEQTAAAFGKMVNLRRSGKWPYGWDEWV